LIDRFVDGTYFIDLAPIRDPNSVLAAIARTIGLSETSNGSMLDDLKGQLREKSMLLLLDNFEQVTSAAVQVAALLQFCPRLKLLITSREALRVRGERLYPVPPLGLPEVDARYATTEELARFEAVQLFVERAQAVRPDFELTDENAGAIAELCLRLDGLPLAIELAAARVRLFSPQALRQRLGSRFKLLQGGARDLPQRQQTLRDTIDWSYELLSPAEKSLLEVVSVFSGCTFEAVEAVAGGIERLGESEMDIAEGLVSLVDKSLIRLADDGAGVPRLRMLETIREFAAERLEADAGLKNAARREHAAYFARFVQHQWRRLAGYEREPALEELAADVENLKIAWRYWVTQGELEQLQKMVDGLWLLYDGRGWYQAMVELTTDLLDVLSSTPSTPEQVQQEITLRTSLARALMALKGYTPEVEEAYTRALNLSQGHGEIPQLFPVLRGLSSYLLYVPG
jgi:predicted ATPase